MDDIKFWENERYKGKGKKKKKRRDRECVCVLPCVDSVTCMSIVCTDSVFYMNRAHARQSHMVEGVQEFKISLEMKCEVLLLNIVSLSGLD